MNGMGGSDCGINFWDFWVAKGSDGVLGGF